MEPVSRSPGCEVSQAVPPRNRETARPRDLLWLGAAGLVTLLGQVVLLREVVVASFGSELIYVLAMGLQMLGTAIGALAGRRVTLSGDRVGALFVVYAVALPLLAAVSRTIRVMFGGTPGAYLPFFEQLAGVALVLLPPGMVGGLLFTSVARLYVGGSGTLASAYAVESAGGVAGGVASTLLLALGVQNLAAAILCGVVAAAAALLTPSRARTAAAAVGALLLVALVWSSALDRALTSLNHPQLLASRDTPYGRATVTGSFGQIVVFVNDALAFESEGTSAEEFVHLAAVQAKRPRSVLLVGGAVEGLAEEVSKHGPTDVREVEVDRGLIALARAYLPRRTVPTFEEPRRFLQRRGKYDLILSAMPEPDSGQASRFYTGEFFHACASRLSPGGVLAFRLRSSENLWTPALARRTASIVAALRSAFSDVVVLPGSVNVVIASNAPLERDPEVLARRFRQRNVQARLVSERYVRYIYANDRGAEIERTLARTPAPPSSDGRPVCYHYTLVLWLSRFFPALARADLRVPPAAWIGVLCAIAATVLVARRSEVRRRTLLVVFAGFAGVVLEGSVILAYQIAEGVLYRDLGLLLTMFMAGLAVGSATAGRHGVFLLLATAATAGLIAWGVASPGRGLWSDSLFLFASGFMTGALFAYASRRRGDPLRAVAPLYAADLLGGVAGSLAVTLLLVPILGIAGSVLAVAILAVIALPLA